LDHTSSGAAASAVAAMFAGSFLLVWIAFFVLFLVINWRIAAKAGYAGALSLLMLIPVFNFIVLLIFAFGKWPLEEQLVAARGYGAGPGSSPGSGGYGTGGTVAPTPYRP